MTDSARKIVPLSSGPEILSEALKDAQEVRSLLQATLESLPAGVVVFGRNGDHRFSNSEAEALLAANPAVFPATDLYAPLFEESGRGAGNPAGLDQDIEIQGPAGDPRIIHRKLARLPATAIREPMVILLLEDVTEELRLRAEILKNGRLTAVLDTWAALNHEINNPLAAILGRAQILLARSTGLDEKAVAGLKVIEESALRIVDLAARLKELTAPSFTEYSRGVTMLDISASTNLPRKESA